MGQVNLGSESHTFEIRPTHIGIPSKRVIFAVWSHRLWRPPHAAWFAEQPDLPSRRSMARNGQRSGVASMKAADIHGRAASAFSRFVRKCSSAHCREREAHVPTRRRRAPSRRTHQRAHARVLWPCARRSRGAAECSAHHQIIDAHAIKQHAAEGRLGRKVEPERAERVWLVVRTGKGDASL